MSSINESQKPLQSPQKVETSPKEKGDSPKIACPWCASYDVKCTGCKAANGKMVVKTEDEWLITNKDWQTVLY